MHAMSHLLAGLAAVVAAAQVGPLRPLVEGSPTGHVPPERFADPADRDLFGRWFGNQLRAMREPILWRPGDLGTFSRRFRMLVLPSFHPAYAIRVDWAPNRARGRAVRLDGAGGYSPGRIAEQENFRLSRGQRERLETMIADVRLASLPAEPGPQADICVDGARFVFELVDESGARFITRHQCELSSELRRLADLVDGLRRTVGSDLHRYN